MPTIGCGKGHACLSLDALFPTIVPAIDQEVLRETSRCRGDEVNGLTVAGWTRRRWSRSDRRCGGFDRGVHPIDVRLKGRGRFSRSRSRSRSGIGFLTPDRLMSFVELLLEVEYTGFQPALLFKQNGQGGLRRGGTRFWT